MHDIDKIKFLYHLNEDDKKLIVEIENKLNVISFDDDLKRQNIKSKARSIYSSLAIEANSLLLESVDDIVNDKLALGSKREIQEVKNAIEFISFVIKCINNILDKTTKKNEFNDIRLNNNQLRIIELIKGNNRITRNQIASILNITTDGVKYNLKKLSDNKIIERVGSAKGGYWKVL